MVLIFNFRKGRDFSVIEGQAPNTVKFTGAFITLGKCKVPLSKTWWDSSAPPVSMLPFKRAVSRRFGKIFVFICLCTIVYFLLVLWGHHQSSLAWLSPGAHGLRTLFQLSLCPSISAPETLQQARPSPVGLEFGFAGFTLALASYLAFAWCSLSPLCPACRPRHHRVDSVRAGGSCSWLPHP